MQDVKDVTNLGSQLHHSGKTIFSFDNDCDYLSLVIKINSLSYGT